MGYFREHIEKAAGYTPGFQPQSSDVVKLNTNENPYPPSPMVLKALAGIDAEQLRRYPDPVGNSFREASAKVNSVKAENIMCCNGGDDLLTIAFRAFCDKSHPVAYPVPTYSLYPVLANLVSCKVIEVPFDGDFDLPSDKLIATGAALTIVCNPNAPSGSLIKIEDMAALASQLDGILLIDEAYVDFAENNCTSLIKDHDNVIILRSMSKGYSLAGLRFGYAIACSNLIAGLMKVKDSYNVDALAIAAATAAIRDKKYLQETIEKVKTQRTALTKQLENLGLEVGDSQTNFILATCKTIEARDVFEKLAKLNIFVRYFNLPGLQDKLRITIGTPDQNDKLVSALKNILK